MKDIYLASCCRTAIGSFGGSLKETPAVQLGSIVAKAALERAGLAPNKLDEVMFGCILTAGLGQNVARQVAIGAGVPVEVPAYTVGMVCGSGMKSVTSGPPSTPATPTCSRRRYGEHVHAPYAIPAARWGARMGPSIWSTPW